MFRCPVCHHLESSSSNRAPDPTPAYDPPFSQPRSKDTFMSAAHFTGYEPKRKKHAFDHPSSASPYFTPPTSPPKATHRFENSSKSSWGAHGFSQTNRGGGAFPFSTPPPCPTRNGTVPISTLNEVQEAMLNLAVENQRLNTMLAHHTKEKEDLVSRHEEQCFRMVDDFVREKEEIWMSSNYSEKKERKSRRKSEPSPPPSTPTLKLECIGGPHSGEKFFLTGTLVVGTKPVAKKEIRNSISLWKDSLVSSTHAKLVLNKSGSKKNPVLMIKVYDINGTKLNNKILPKGSNRMAFVKDRIQVGNSVLLVMKMK